MIYDLHTHILPGIDDGAATVDESILLLQAQLADGVGAVALTPHFRTDIMDLDTFLIRRVDACRRLYGTVREKKLPIGLVLGAEVMFSASLPETRLEPLCYDGTKTILIELPVDFCPPYLREVLFTLISKGYTPVIAHVERYPYFARNLSTLKELVEGGVLAQVNTESFAAGGNTKTRKRVLSMLRKGLVHIVATDMHRAGGRAPALGKTLAEIKKKTGIDMTIRMRRLGL